MEIPEDLKPALDTLARSLSEELNVAASVIRKRLVEIIKDHQGEPALALFIAEASFRGQMKGQPDVPGEYEPYGQRYTHTGIAGSLLSDLKKSML